MENHRTMSNFDAHDFVLHLFCIGDEMEARGFLDEAIEQGEAPGWALKLLSQIFSARAENVDPAVARLMDDWVSGDFRRRGQERKDMRRRERNRRMDRLKYTNMRGWHPEFDQWQLERNLNFVEWASERAESMGWNSRSPWQILSYWRGRCTFSRIDFDNPQEGDLKRFLVHHCHANWRNSQEFVRDLVDGNNEAHDGIQRLVGSGALPVVLLAPVRHQLDDFLLDELSYFKPRKPTAPPPYAPPASKPSPTKRRGRLAHLSSTQTDWPNVGPRPPTYEQIVG
jgi:hypothetical protein